LTKTICSHSQVSMPTMLYGTAWKKERTAELVERALIAGFRGIDTACQPRHYNEPGVGIGIQNAVDKGIPRASIFVQTKFTPVNGQDPQSIPYDKNASLGTQVVQSFKVSQHNLQTKIIDSLIVHGPYPDWDDMMEVWSALENLAQQGLVRQIGISNCYDPDYFGRLYQAAAIKPAILQNRFYAETGFDIELRKFCSLHKIVYQSFWTLTANPRILSHSSMRQIADALQCTTAQLFFAFLMTQGIQPLTGTTSEEHIRLAVDVGNIKIIRDQIDVIAKLGPFI
jgi:diketogulonate reductase-like aldo/keto reductase